MKPDSIKRCCLVFALMIWGIAPSVFAQDVVLEECSYDRINTAIRDVKAGDGGVVYLPSCDVSLADAEGNNRGLKLPPGVSIMGNGKDQTILRDTGFYHGSDYGVGQCGDETSRIAHLSVINDFETRNNVWEIRKIKGLRIDNCNFEGRYSTFIKLSMAPGNSNYFLMDHCELNLITSYGIYTHHDNSYVDNINSDDYKSLLGSNDKSTIFVEDCQFTGTYDHLMDGRSGAHYVFRYNRVHYSAPKGGGPIEGHGPTNPNWDTLNAGTNCMEIYNNEIMNPSTIPFGEGASGILIRSGCAVVFNNKIGYKRWGVALAIEGSPYNWDMHDGLSPVDDPYPAGYPAYNQTHGVWIWGNELTSVQIPVGIVWDSQDGNVAKNYLVEERDYFLREPSLGQDGFAYTPYQYPHPLVSGDADPDPGPDLGPDPDDNTGSNANNDTSGSGCFIGSLKISSKELQY